MKIILYSIEELFMDLNYLNRLLQLNLNLQWIFQFDIGGNQDFITWMWIWELSLTLLIFSKFLTISAIYDCISQYAILRSTLNKRWNESKLKL